MLAGDWLRASWGLARITHTSGLVVFWLAGWVHMCVHVPPRVPPFGAGAAERYARGSSDYRKVLRLTPAVGIKWLGSCPSTKAKGGTHPVSRDKHATRPNATWGRNLYNGRKRRKTPNSRS